jgi:hypothetical protein
VNTSPEARPILERLVQSLQNAQKLHFEGRKTHPNAGGGQAAGPGKDKVPDTQQKYYLSNEGGMTRIRVESSVMFQGMNITTLFIKNEAGIWEVMMEQVCEVSKVFTRDQLLGVFPFHRLFSCLEHPYELDLAGEHYGGTECFVISGKLADMPVANGPDIAREFAYRVGESDERLYSIHERTFGTRSLDLELDEFELNMPLDPVLFELPNKPRVVALSLEQYMEFRNQDMTNRLRAA